MSLKILSIDPGLNIGLAMRFDNGSWGTMTFRRQDDLDANILELILDIKERMPGTVIIESFVGRQMFNRDSIETTEVLGALRGACIALDIRYIKQTPSVKTTREPTARFLLEERRAECKRLKIEGGRFTNHEISALAHLLAYEARQVKLAKLCS